MLLSNHFNIFWIILIPTFWAVKTAGFLKCLDQRMMTLWHKRQHRIEYRTLVQDFHLLISFNIVQDVHSLCPFCSILSNSVLTPLDFSWKRDILPWTILNDPQLKGPSGPLVEGRWSIGSTEISASPNPTQFSPWHRLATKWQTLPMHEVKICEGAYSHIASHWSHWFRYLASGPYVDNHFWIKNRARIYRCFRVSLFSLQLKNLHNLHCTHQRIKYINSNTNQIPIISNYALSTYETK